MVWTKTADQNLDTPATYRQQIYDLLEEMKMFPFHDEYPLLLTPDVDLESALNAAYGEAQAAFPSTSAPKRVGCSIVLVDDSVTPTIYRQGGIRNGNVYYSASLLKVAAMYAAYELRNSVNAAARTLTATTSTELFAQLTLGLNPLISAAVPQVTTTPGITEVMKVPNHSKIFVAIPLMEGGFALDFSGDFADLMRLMIVQSDNEAAAQCIQRLGYSWINGALASAGFFNSDSQRGIWLAGTFTGSETYVRIMSDNHGLSAQATTCADLANMYALLNDRQLVDPGSSESMLTLLADAQDAEPGWVTRPDMFRMILPLQEPTLRSASDH